MAHGKRYRNAYEKIDRDNRYSPGEAIGLVKQTANRNFDQTVEVHLRLGVNVRHAEEQLRGTLAMPRERPRRPARARSVEQTSRRRSRAAGWNSTSPSPRRT